MVFGFFNTVTLYKFQDYHKLKEAAQKAGELFKDPEFPANDKALFTTEGKLAGIEWKRPKVSKSNIYVEVYVFCEMFTCDQRFILLTNFLFKNFECCILVD